MKLYLKFKGEMERKWKNATTNGALLYIKNRKTNFTPTLLFENYVP